jgi:hypothetical protein
MMKFLTRGFALLNGYHHLLYLVFDLYLVPSKIRVVYLGSLPFGIYQSNDGFHLLEEPFGYLS